MTKCFAVLSPPTKIELTLAGKAKEHSSEIESEEGTYILTGGQVNGYPHWLKIDGIQAIWFCKLNANWSVGKKEECGTDYAVIVGPEGKDSYPNEIKQGWQYSDNGFKDAGPNDVIFKAIG